MLKLMKYEFRKTMFSKMLLLGITGIMELVFLAGVFFKQEEPLGFGTMGLVICAVVGIIYIGIESINVFHRDLNTKQSYMLFMTPNSSYKILGAKVLENGFSILVAGLFFAALASIDLSVAILYIGGLEEFLEMIEEVLKNLQLNILVEGKVVFMSFLSALASWLLTIVTADLAIVLSATVLAGKKYSGFVGFVIFILLATAGSKVMSLSPAMDNVYMNFALVIAISFLLTAVMYCVTAWIMDKKLSV